MDVAGVADVAIARSASADVYEESGGTASAQRVTRSKNERDQSWVSG
ncbi:hypothetical protein PENANT_c027G02938 [Penicillium antarcticum]|uniref:Uncharacterized protein n=1 Tax=Penicillium antarcticum TaxID=416450 RepID=A0A1V6PWT2_9EURO|nr:hypothetical protein PENANT_c027G02938 [Penicillium antarcticum]